MTQSDFDGQVLWNKKQSFWGFHWNSYLFVSRIVNREKKTHTHTTHNEILVAV